MSLSGTATSLNALFVSFFALSSIFVSLRIFVRSRKTKNFGSDDCFLLASLAAFALFTASGLLSVLHGIGTQFTRTSFPATLSVALRYYFISEISSLITITLLRISFALHLFILAKSPAQRLSVLFIITLTILVDTGFFLVVLFQTDPIQYFWTGWVGEVGKTVDEQLLEVASYGYAGVGAGVDWVLILCSPWFLGDGEFGGRVRFCLRGCIILGICAGTAALIRIPTTKALMTTADFFVDCVPIAVGSTLEAGLGMMALSASTFRPLYPSFFVVKPKECSVPPVSPSLGEKLSLESTASHSRNSSSVTGAQIPSRTTVQRKVSEEKPKYGWAESDNV